MHVICHEVRVLCDVCLVIQELVGAVQACSGICGGAWCVEYAEADGDVRPWLAPGYKAPQPGSGWHVYYYDPLKSQHVGPTWGYLGLCYGSVETVVSV